MNWSATISEAPTGNMRWRRLGRMLTPYFIGLCFILLGISDIPEGNPIHQDAAMHAMNGALVHDYIRQCASTGDLQHPVRYSLSYHNRLPAFSIPYHPPLFPVLEACFYGVLGTSLLAARMAVAVTVIAAAVLMFQLFLSTHSSYILATAATIVFLSLPMTHSVANDVMLEFPSLALQLAAILCLSKLFESHKLAPGIFFAIFAGMAMWTKQNTVFLGLIPFCFVLLTGSWQLLKSRILWIPTFILALIVILWPLTRPNSGYAGTLHEVPIHVASQVLHHHLFYYAESMVRELGMVFSLWVGVSVLLALLDLRNKAKPNSSALYLAWILSYFFFIAFIGKYDYRYLLFVYPALILLGLDRLTRVLQAIAPKRYVDGITLAIPVWFLVFLLLSPKPVLSGPNQAADYIHEQGGSRILFSGTKFGAFIFAVRSNDSQGNATVVLGNKRGESIFHRENIDQFAHRHGIQYIVLEKNDRPSLWQERFEHLWNSPTPEMKLEKEFDFLNRSAEGHVTGKIRVYRFLNPSLSPEPFLQPPGG